MAKNDDIRRLCDLHGVEWVEIARSLDMPIKDLVRRLNARTITPEFRRHVMEAIEKIRQRPEDFYDEYR